MLSNQELVQKALMRFQSGYNCTQSVLLTLYEHMTPEGNSQLIPKIGSGFGGGMGLCGSVCGSLTGSIMAVGIKYGSNDAGEEKNLRAYAKANALYQNFEKKHGSILCRELIKIDLTKPEQVAKARQEGVFEKICANFVKTAVKDYLEIENK
jgi:C_GCAxxG_C_C family probable redox protein